MERSRRIVICDRSASRARALRRFLEHDPEIEVCGAFGDLESMLSGLAEAAPDLIALDAETIGADAPAAVEATMREGQAPILIVGVAGDDDRWDGALAVDAVEAVPGDRLHLDEPKSLWATALRGRIKRLSSRRLRRRGADADAATPPWRRPGPTYRVVGIGASVGGPPALATLLGLLPASYPLPVLVVQHMASGFGDSLTKWLDESVALPVGRAADGAVLQPGVWMAPEGTHLRLEPTMRLSLDRATRRGVHRPSLDVLFESLAATAGEEAVGVVLTGMGRDGAEGIRAIADAGGLTIAQDEETSAVFGMPAAAIESGAELTLPLEELASRLAKLRAGGAAE